MGSNLTYPDSSTRVSLLSSFKSSEDYPDDSSSLSSPSLELLSFCLHFPRWLPGTRGIPPIAPALLHCSPVPAVATVAAFTAVTYRHNNVLMAWRSLPCYGRTLVPGQRTWSILRHVARLEMQMKTSHQLTDTDPIAHEIKSQNHHNKVTVLSAHRTHSM